MQLSIIIVNFNTFQLTFNCIQSIKANVSAIDYEIILVDNAPRENHQEKFKNAFPEILYLHSTENIGFGSANNLGISHARGKYILLINSDTLVLDDSIEKCFLFMEGDLNEKIGVLGCKLLNSDKSFQSSFYPFTNNTIWNYLLTNNWLLFKVFNVSKKYQETDQTLMVGDVSGAFMFIRKKVIDKVQAFDPDFFLYCEETEWCRERIARYFKLIYYPKAAIVHFGGQSAPRAPMQVQAKLSLALVWYKKGWYHYLQYLLISYLNTFCNTLLLPFVQKQSRKNILADLNSSIKVLPYLFTEVTRYKRQWGSRKTPLIYKGASSIFFDTNAMKKIHKNQ